MTDRERELQGEVDVLKEMLQKQKDDVSMYSDQHREDWKEISALRKRCQELEAKQTPPSEMIESGLIEKLFFACLLAEGISNDADAYYGLLIDALRLTEKFKKWKENQE